MSMIIDRTFFLSIKFIFYLIKIYIGDKIYSRKLQYYAIGIHMYKIIFKKISISLQKDAMGVFSDLLNILNK